MRQSEPAPPTPEELRAWRTFAERMTAGDGPTYCWDDYHRPMYLQQLRLICEVERLRAALKHIHAMADDDLRQGHGENGNALYQIEADARAALGEVEQ